MVYDHDSVPTSERRPTHRRIRPEAGLLTDDVLFGNIWRRRELPARDRSLVTVAVLITNGSTEQLRPHLQIAKDNGLTETELKEVIIHRFLCRLAARHVRHHRRQRSVRGMTSRPTPTRL
jgi:4-carboxymuconolactone decarboxylase